jgi:glycine hydroxymethyltransferase
MLHTALAVDDPVLACIIDGEKRRQRNSISLIASENVTSQAVHDALASVLCNKYSEGYPGARYYGGNEWIDRAEGLCVRRALACFRLDADEWGVNVQSLSGTPANFQAYTALLPPQGRLMGLELSHGGHLSHGFATPSGKAVSATAAYFDSRPYYVSEETERIDMDGLQLAAEEFRPQLVIAGVSAYPRLLDYERFRSICDSVGAYLLADMSHVSGLVAAGLVPSPFDHADVVTTTTHKTLRGPRGALIFYRKRQKARGGGTIAHRINAAVFPGLQGGPHNHTIAAVATALRQANTPAFVSYQRRVLANAQRLAAELQQRGYVLATDGTDTHMVLVDLRRSAPGAKNGVQLDGAAVEEVLDGVGVAVNKNTVVGDTSALTPHGVRLGTAAVSSRGCGVDDMPQLADFFDRSVRIALAKQDAVAFGATAAETTGDRRALACDVSAFARQFPPAAARAT